jgi:hypothetical protein
VIITNVPAEITFPIAVFLLLNPIVIPAAREACLALSANSASEVLPFRVAFCAFQSSFFMSSASTALRDWLANNTVERIAPDPDRHRAADHQSSFCVVSGGCQHYR